MRNEKNPDGSKKYPDADNNPDLYRDAYTEFVSYFEEIYATGGRVGYQAGNSVMPGATQATSTGGYDTSGLQGYDTEGGFQPSNLQGFPDQGVDGGLIQERVSGWITAPLTLMEATRIE